MKTVCFDALSTSAPMNKQAAIARDGRGDHYTPKKLHVSTHSVDPIPLKAIKKKHRHDSNFIDHTGKKIDRLTVVGMADDSARSETSKKKGSVWVVRCVCGRFETRRNKALTNPHKMTEGRVHQCAECDRLSLIKRRANPRFAKDYAS